MEGRLVVFKESCLAEILVGGLAEAKLGVSTIGVVLEARDVSRDSSNRVFDRSALMFPMKALSQYASSESQHNSPGLVGVG